jgi:hypothetical protein
LQQKYNRIKVLGKGGFGEAVLVEEKTSKKKYVIKEVCICCCCDTEC